MSGAPVLTGLACAAAKEPAVIRTTLLKRVEGLELWTTVSGRAQVFAVRLRTGRARVFDSLEAAERLMGAALRQARTARAH